MKKRIATALALLLLVFAGVPASAQTVPYENYTYAEADAAVVAGPQAYLPARLLRGEALGIGAFSAPADLDADDNGDLYLLDAGNNRVVVLDASFACKRTFPCAAAGTVSPAGLSGAQGITVTESSVYICDTGNGRILVYDKSDGALRQTVSVRDVPAAGDDFLFKPTRVAVDDRGGLYVVSNGTYEGIVNLNAEGAFLGFFAGSSVTASTWDLFWRRFSTVEQRKNMVQLVPQDFSSIDQDSDGFFFVTTYKQVNNAMVRRINPGGNSVLRSKSNISLVGDPARYPNGTLAGENSFCDVAAGEDKTFACLDRTRGRIFCYSSDGSLLYTFGNRSAQVGGFNNPVSLCALSGNRFLVVDAADNSLTVFTPTDYALRIHQGLRCLQNLDYPQAQQIWETVLAQNGNFDFARNMVGQSYYNEGRYTDAMYCFRATGNREMYSDARQALRTQWIASHARLLVLAAALLILLWVVCTLLRRRYRKNHPPRPPRFPRLRERLHFLGYLYSHPFDGFWILKREHKAGWGDSLLLLVLLILSCALRVLCSGYLFTIPALEHFSVWLLTLLILCLVLLYCVSSWGLTTLMDGKGTAPEIFFALMYALTPITLINLPITLLSQVLLLREAAFLSFLSTFSVLWAIFLVLAANLSIHEYSMTKSIATTALTVVGMAAVAVVALLVGNLIQQVWIWITSVASEIAYRR